jgi:SAM-dependent methyltransferase
MIFRRLLAEFGPTKDAFDSELSIKTARPVSLRRLLIPSPNKSLGVRYQPVCPQIFNEAIRHVSKDLIFLDLGRGKGRALILAHQAGFRELVGVEFSPRLASVARDNLKKLQISASIFVQDVVTFSFPKQPAVTFLYNPFGSEVLHKIVSRFRGYIVYVNPQHRQELAEFRVIAEGTGFVVYRS